mmetsp:Transcript_12182/g.21838  ORF Transcript_12182/g.21838 Transcript_12182/m.21838 type:complete len:97 (-) Transcript_12182:93-383(-)
MFDSLAKRSCRCCETCSNDTANEKDVKKRKEGEREGGREEGHKRGVGKKCKRGKGIYVFLLSYVFFLVIDAANELIHNYMYISFKVYIYFILKVTR